MPTIARLFSATAFVLSLFAIPALATPVSFEAADHVTVYADYTGVANSARPIVLLFHQAGANGSEYAGIAKHLDGLGYDALAVDQRSGGSAFGRANKTVQKRGASTDYLEALPDMQAAVDWAATHEHHSKIIVWGSSYSSSLVFVLAGSDPRVSAVLAFSPGEYFADRTLVRRAAAKVHQPVLVSSASDASEIEAAASILASVAGDTKVQLKPRGASHGSAALNGSAAKEIWPGVERFLAEVK